MAEDTAATDSDGVVSLAGRVADLNVNVCEFLNHTPEIIDVDPRGDRILVVGTNTCEITDHGHEHEGAMRFRVCSQALGRFSPVMEAMLFGRFIEATQETINFPEDHPPAMQILLHVAHGNLEPVYTVLSSNQINMRCCIIFDVVKLANKYLAVLSLRPWVDEWTRELARHAEIGHCLNDNGRETIDICIDFEEILIVAGEFGHLGLYQSAFKFLAMNQAADRELFSHCLAPSGVADQILAARMKSLHRILQILQEVIDILMNKAHDESPTGSYTCSAKGPTTQIICRRHTLAVLMIHLTNKSLWPLPQAENIAEGVFSLHKRVTEDMWSDRGSHKDCALRSTLTLALKQAMDISPDLLSPPQPLCDSMLERSIMLDVPWTVGASALGNDGVVAADYGDDTWRSGTRGVQERVPTFTGHGDGGQWDFSSNGWGTTPASDVWRFRHRKRPPAWTESLAVSRHLRISQAQRSL